ncbi:hypothetical protein JL721_3321 [Aureococcus anophagefferens]|nr:hypothetical protein JL721_3321 [Aureococcus anophagefferens]
MPSIPRSFGLLVLSRVVVPRPPDWQDKPRRPRALARARRARGGWECGVVMAVDNTYWNTVNAFGRYARDYIPMYEADLDRMGIRHLPVGSGCPAHYDSTLSVSDEASRAAAPAEIDHLHVDMDSSEANWGYCDGTSDEICVPCAPSDAEPAPSCDAVADPCEGWGDLRRRRRDLLGQLVQALRDWAPSRRRRQRPARAGARRVGAATGATTAASEPTTTAAAADGDDGDALTASASLYVLGACILLVGVAIGVGLSRRLKSRRRHIDAHCVELADVATRVDPPRAEIVSVNPFGEKEELIMQAHC